VQQDQLGLFDTPPGERQIRSAAIVIVLLAASFLLVLPFADARLRPAPGFIPAIDAALLVCELVIACMLCALASVYRSRALAILAAGNVFTGLLYASHALTFPGAFAPAGLLGAGINSTSWLAQFRRAGLPIALIVYVLLKRREAASGPIAERPAAPVGIAMVAAIALAAAVTIFATAGHEFLPTVFRNRLEVIHLHTLRVETLMFALFVAAFLILYRNRSSLLDLWLLVAAACWLLQSLLIMTLLARNTAGFYALMALILVSHLVLMLALIGESARLHARLALSNAARNREREARLMSMDAVAGAIAHEIGQPLTAISLNAQAGLSWLARDKPDVEMAVKALRAAIEAGNRATDAIKSIRALFAQRRGKATRFSLNDLVRDTASLLDRELAAERASLQLLLDEALPPIRADRLQLQLVLVNLFANALEAMVDLGEGPRRIAIRSAPVNDDEVMLEFSDCGAGIDPDRIERIFDAFYTTKPTGTGLGLALCRTIVEGHGGRLWASSDADQGATFHLRLPSESLAAA
jgi:signal transduction histidine kinase